MDLQKLFDSTETLNDPSTIFWRSIELKHLKENVDQIYDARKILDLGCGEGFVAKALFEGNIVDYGIDNWPDMVKKAKKSGVYQTVLLGDAAKHIPLADGSVNLVISNSVLEHIQDLNGVLNEIVRILGPDGYLVFTAPSCYLKQASFISRLNIPNISAFYGRWRDRKFQHYHAYSLNRWKTILKQHRLKFVAGRYYLSPEEVRIWDTLLWISKISGLFGLNFQRRLYQIFLKSKIYRLYMLSRTSSSQGGSLYLVAQRNS